MRPPKPHELKKLAITKIDAACRQLETAITLWFHDGDPVSVHMLVMAAHGILKAINKKRGQPMLTDPPPDIRPELRKRVADMFVKSANFFKHGNRDPLETHNFSPEFNQVMILDACNAYITLAEEHRPLMKTFMMYLVIHQPSIFPPVSVAAIQLPPVLVARAKEMSKAQFFADWLPSAFAAVYMPRDG
jgi:hypothetical protein